MYWLITNMKYFALIAIAVLVSFNTFSSAKKVEYMKTFKSAGNGNLGGLYDEWWQAAVIYQIYPRSFKDSDNDGNGDLQGIIQRLDHFTDMGVDGIWLSPIYKSPQVDNGYDISDYRDVDEMYGTLADLRQLIDEAHTRNLKVILDYVPNHTSDQHEWFQASLKGIAPYDEYYIWRNATYVNGERKPPNNWLSAFRGPAWEWREERQQYYYHKFAIAQPDLNYRNPKVVEEMEDVLRYWLNFGADGFRMDAVQNLFEDVLLRDEPPSEIDGVDPDDPNSLDHIYTVDQNETFDMIYQFREVLDSFNAENGTYTRIMMTEVYSNMTTTLRYYISEDHTRLGAHFSFNFLTFIIGLKKGFNAVDLVRNVTNWIYEIPAGLTSNWVLGNHDIPRVATRLGVENIDALNILAGLLEGTLITYQGEEIGQENGEVTCEQGYDPQAIKNCSTFNQTSRDFERTPFQWDNSTNAGFDEGNTTWLPVSEKYLNTNLALQNVSEVNSHYNIYKSILQIRRVFKDTDIDALYWGTDPENFPNIFYAERITEYADYLLLFNIGEVEQAFLDPDYADFTLVVELTSLNSDYNIREIFRFNQPLKPKEAVLMKFIILE